MFVDEHVQVPKEYVKNSEIVLNVGFEATSALKLGNELIEFKARFGGTSREIAVPIDHVIAIYARENGQGMAFPVPVAGASGEDLPRASPLSSVPAAGGHGDEDPKVVQLVTPEPAITDNGPDGSPPKPPSGSRPA